MQEEQQLSGPIIDASLVSLDLKAVDAVSAIDELAHLLKDAKRIDSFDVFVADVLKRDSEVSTEVGWGVSIPHARSAAVLKPTICFGRSKGFHWKEDSTEETKLVFMLAAPVVATNKRYMRMLSSLARMLLEPDFREACLQSDNCQNIVDVIQDAIKQDADNF